MPFSIIGGPGPLDHAQNDVHACSGDEEAQLLNDTSNDEKDGVKKGWNFTIPFGHCLKRSVDCQRVRSTASCLNCDKKMILWILLVVAVSAITSIVIVYSHKAIVNSNFTTVELEQHMNNIEKKVRELGDSVKSINETVKITKGELTKKLEELEDSVKSNEESIKDIGNEATKRFEELEHSVKSNENATKDIEAMATKKIEKLEDSVRNNSKAVENIKDENEKKFQDLEISVSNNDKAISSMETTSEEFQNLITKLQGDINRNKAEIRHLRNAGVKTVTTASLTLLLLAIIAMMINL